MQWDFKESLKTYMSGVMSEWLLNSVERFLLVTLPDMNDIILISIYEEL